MTEKLTEIVGKFIYINSSHSSIFNNNQNNNSFIQQSLKLRISTLSIHLLPSLSRHQSSLPPLEQVSPLSLSQFEQSFLHSTLLSHLYNQQWQQQLFSSKFYKVDLKDQISIPLVFFIFITFIFRKFPRQSSVLQVGEFFCCLCLLKFWH